MLFAWGRRGRGLKIVELKKVLAPAALLAGLLVLSASGAAVAQEQTTKELPLPAGQAKQQSEDRRWQITFDSEWRYFSTKDTAPGSSAYQKTRFTYLPIGLQFAAIPTDEWKVEISVRSGYIDLRQSASTGARAGYSGWTDTSVTGTITYYGFDGFQPFFSLASNVPTGNSSPAGNVAQAPADPDVVQLQNFGEGLNIGPTVGVNIPITKDLLATVSVGHTIRGSYDRLGPNLGVLQPGFGARQTVSPGDVTTAVASLGYQVGAWSLQSSFSYSSETNTKVDLADFFQSGGKFNVSAGVGYAFTDDLAAKLSGSFTHTEKNRVPADAFNGNFALLSEAFNTNSNVFSVGFDTSYRIGSFAFGPTVSYLYRDRNGYDTETSQFVPAKTKVSAGGVVQYAVNDHISFNLRAEHLWVTLSPNPGVLPQVPRIDTDGWLISVGGKAQF